MTKPTISIIAAVAEHNVIGKGNRLLWYISPDFKRFKAITSGHPIIMGRKTHESIGKPLPNRTNIIVTRDKEYTKEGCVTAYSLEEALEKAKKVDQEELFIIGGGELYRQALPYADKLYLTLVHAQFDGDVYFPDYSEFKTVLSKEEHESDGYTYTFINLTR